MTHSTHFIYGYMASVNNNKTPPQKTRTKTTTHIIPKNNNNIKQTNNNNTKQHFAKQIILTANSEMFHKDNHKYASTM